ncbi:MAG: hypothetical protein QRY16_17120 [Enterobacterales bacterium endosymbiont of Blomia tropicalis]|uniref:hypothetical protein n=1 Tax=Mixta mediterraneensis TaxID=2758443 RepID=UPI0025A8B230|nr:hypothetical protein [Mixta mediterraneensis]MDL4915425.1 hypothetical protein [Mixta mediterraneensis]
MISGQWWSSAYRVDKDKLLIQQGKIKPAGINRQIASDYSYGEVYQQQNKWALFNTAGYREKYCAGYHR